MTMSVDLDRLRALLAQAAESDDLDYKATWDPREKSDLIELCKDIAAMESMPTGGYILVGADDHGSPSGMFAGDPASNFMSRRSGPRWPLRLASPSI